ncbi:hypothetical protein BJ508DRAFT_151686 [Ascobolus immersus RN42]|uniref:Uncharacterized protein n=1 Tax=Ascobolus immersus RN42 TaxID=1160509 RepID=A0A3N4HYB3_ASCIM|nr:hypothetical protein BJ508DRAFT_151686 [Ascobolus immersus RN42]
MGGVSSMGKKEHGKQGREERTKGETEAGGGRTLDGVGGLDGDGGEEEERGGEGELHGCGCGCGCVFVGDVCL